MNVGQSIDGAGEQTLMKSSNTTGRLHGLASLLKQVLQIQHGIVKHREFKKEPYCP